jgi:uncharacterized protein involved in exopolysaccharide biosynthesis
LQESGSNLGKSHPQYQRMEAELASMKQQLAAETKTVTSSFTASGNASKAREASLQAAINAQKKIVLRKTDFKMLNRQVT